MTSKVDWKNTLERQNMVAQVYGIKPSSIILNREAVAIVDINDPSQIPSFSEPFYLNFNAECEFRIAMSPEDLGKAGLDQLGKQWS